MTLQEWINKCRMDDPDDREINTNLYKSLRIIEHLLKAVEWYNVHHNHQVINLAKEALEACEKEINL